MGDNYYSIHPPDVVSFTEENHIPPSPLSSAPNTPTHSVDKRTHNKHISNTTGIQFPDSEDDLKGPPRVSRQLLPPSMKSPTFSKLPSAVMSPNQTWGSTQKKKKKSFMKKRDVPFDETPKLQFSSTERTLRMLKGETTSIYADDFKKQASTPPPTTLSSSHRSASSRSRYSLDAPHDEVSSRKKKPVLRLSVSMEDEEEAPDDERGARMRNILAEMDEMEDNINLAKSGDSEDISSKATTASKSKSRAAPAISPPMKKNSEGIPMEISLSGDSGGIPPPKNATGGEEQSQQDEFMRSGSNATTTTDELMERKPIVKRDDIMNGADEIMNASIMTSSSSPTKSSKDSSSSRANEIVTAASIDASSSTRSSPNKQPSVAATSKNSESPSSSAKEPAAQSMAEMALSWLTPTAAVTTAATTKATANTSTTAATTTLSTSDVQVSEKKLNAMDSKMNKNIGKIQEQVSRYLVIPEEIQEDVSFNNMLSDAAYFSNVAASTLVAAGRMAVDSLNPCEKDAAAAAAAEKEVPAEPKTPEEIAAEWRQKRLMMEAGRSELVYDSSPYSFLAYNMFAAGSEDDDDKTRVATNHLIDDLRVEEYDDKSRHNANNNNAAVGSIGALALTRRGDELGPPPPPPAPSRSGSVSSTSSGVTGWWLEKELARREREQKMKKAGDRKKSSTRDGILAGVAVSDKENLIEQNTTTPTKDKHASMPPISADGADIPQDASSEDQLSESKNIAVHVEIEVDELAEENATTTTTPVEEEKKEEEFDPAANVKAPTALVAANDEATPTKEFEDSDICSTRSDSVADIGDIVAEEQNEENNSAAAAAVIGATVVTSTAMAATIATSDSADIKISVEAAEEVDTAEVASKATDEESQPEDTGTEEVATEDIVKQARAALSPYEKTDSSDEEAEDVKIALKEEEAKDVKIDSNPEEMELSGVEAKADQVAKATGSTNAISVFKTDDADCVDACDIASVGTEVLSNKAPILIKSVDDVNGICKGDILLSLVHAKGVDRKQSTSGASQVRNAVWRMRIMRRRLTLRETGKLTAEPLEPDSQMKGVSPPSRARSSLPVDVDDMRVVGGKNQTRALEGNAINHLCHDAFEDASELYDDIHHAYTETFKQRDWTSGNGIVGEGQLDTKEYLGNALHNMGICHFLNNDYKEALSCFEKAAENRKSPDGAPNSDELTTLVKIALCHHGLEDFSKSHKQLELCMEAAKGYCKTITDFIQIAEILNNLGCLSFMGGEHDTALKMFAESLDVQQAILSHSLYGGSVLAGHSTNLNISITRANVAFLKLCADDHLAAILSFESALATQQMLLYDAHETLIGTMDHLAAANLLGGKKENALNMLERMLRAQAGAYGAEDPRCESTRQNIGMMSTNVCKVKRGAAVESDSASNAKSNTSSKGVSKETSSKGVSKETSSKGVSKANSFATSKSSSRSSSMSNASAGKVDEAKTEKKPQKTSTLLRKLSTTLLKKPSMLRARQPSNGGANLLSL